MTCLDWITQEKPHEASQVKAIPEASDLTHKRCCSMNFKYTDFVAKRRWFCRGKKPNHTTRCPILRTAAYTEQRPTTFISPNDKLSRSVCIDLLRFLSGYDGIIFDDINADERLVFVKQVCHPFAIWDNRPPPNTWKRVV